MAQATQFPRRSVLAATAALIAVPGLAFGAASRISLTGALKQGGLVLGKTEPGASVMFEGTPIHAPADGIVSLIDDQYLNGLFTILDHGHGVSTNYVHQSKQLVKLGDKVTRGQMIGEIGQTGRATGPNLHWGMTWFQIGLDA